MQILIGSTCMLICSFLNMRFSKVSMQVQRWTCVDVLFELVQMRILALYVTKTLNFFVVTSLLQNVAIRTDITCRFLAFILWKMQKIRKFCMLPVQILYSMFEPLLAWNWWWWSPRHVVARHAVTRHVVTKHVVTRYVVTRHDQPSGAGGTRSPPATPQRLQHLTARLIQNGWQGLEKG